MPELPEVETMVRGVRPAAEGRELVAVLPCPCACRPISLQPKLSAMARHSVGQTVSRVYRRAKRVVLELANGSAFVIEPRMTGLMLLNDPPDVEHLRIEWRLAGNGTVNSIWFWDRRGLGTVRLLPPAELQTLLGTERLGPDALEMSADAWRERCRRTARPIKVALLDQKLAAGIGNLYASEILHVARISPLKPADRLTRDQVRRLQAAVQEVLLDAIAHEGSTLSDGTYRNVLNQDGGYQNAHRVYARGGETCPTCRAATVQRIVQAQRSTFYCPRCQRR